MNQMKEKSTRPVFPKRAVITAGMPYGNKELHFGHIGGMFVHADTFARFLRDRIGKENVVFVSGTDCYGSPILESFRRMAETQEREAPASLKEYVERNHRKQKEVLSRYEISTDCFAASALGRAGEIHKKVSKEVFEELYQKGKLKLLATPQFYDSDYKTLLNGRQVTGRCPIEGCSSEKAYADECSLGHQYMPSELIDPKSALSGKTPEIKEVQNWYFDLEDCTEQLKEMLRGWSDGEVVRPYVIRTIEEFLKLPVIYIQKKQIASLEELVGRFPKHRLLEEDNKPSVTFEFASLPERDRAREILNEMGVHYRTGKTLVPFRLSGNIDWGVPVPEKDGIGGLTFWVWPESLWAPVSFIRTWLLEQGRPEEEWKKWFCSEEAQVYQFIGEDNIYFYGIAEMAIFQVLFPECKTPLPVANRHILFMDKKAGSSSEVKPPMAEDLLQYYTPEQLRIHFLSLGLSNKSSSFKPQCFQPEKEGADPVLKEGNLLTNVFNRLLRSCLYTVQSYQSSIIPLLPPCEEIQKASEEAALAYELHMYHHEYHRITYVLDDYIRLLNKHWSNRSKQALEIEQEREQLLADCFYGIKTALLLLHPIAPEGCEMAREYLGFSEKVWDWEYLYAGVKEILVAEDGHTRFLEPRVDFFKKHESQLAEKSGL